MTKIQTLFQKLDPKHVIIYMVISNVVASFFVKDLVVSAIDQGVSSILGGMYFLILFLERRDRLASKNR